MRSKADLLGSAQRRAASITGDVIAGSPEQLVEQLAPFVALGMEYFMPIFTDFPSTADLQLFADAVIPALRMHAETEHRP